MRRLLAIICVLMTTVPAFALQPSELLADPALEARARALSAQLRCLVCQNQSIDDSEAPLARDLRGLIREQLVRGESDAQIMDYVVARYGEFVLLKPRFTLQTALLWATPFAVLLIAVVTLIARRRPAAQPAEQPLTDVERQVLQKIME